MLYEFFGAFTVQLQNNPFPQPADWSQSRWFGFNRLIFSALLDLVVLWFQDLFTKLDAASYRTSLWVGLSLFAS